MIEITEVSSVISYIGSLFLNLWVPLSIFIGIPLAFYIFNQIEKTADIKEVKKREKYLDVAHEKQKLFRAELEKQKKIIEKIKH